MLKIESYLIQLGFTENEAQLYEALLKMGPTTIKDLASETSLNRTTVHFSINSLVEKGLASEMHGGSRRKIVAEGSRRLQIFLESKIRQMHELQSQFKYISTNIEEITSKFDTTKKTEISFFKDKKGIQTIYEDAVGAYEVYSYIQIDKMPKNTFQSFSSVETLLKRNENIKIFEIIDSLEEIKRISTIFSKNLNYKNKTCPMSLKLSASNVLLYKDKIAIITVVNNELNSVVVSNKEYHSLCLEVFNFIWNIIT